MIPDPHSRIFFYVGWLRLWEKQWIDGQRYCRDHNTDYLSQIEINKNARASRGMRKAKRRLIQIEIQALECFDKND